MYAGLRSIAAHLQVMCLLWQERQATLEDAP